MPCRGMPSPDADCARAGADGTPIPTHIMERMAVYSRRNQDYDTTKKAALQVGQSQLIECDWKHTTHSAFEWLPQACSPLMDLFVACTKKHGMLAVVWQCRAENRAMDDCMKIECAPPTAYAILRRARTRAEPPWLVMVAGWW